MLDGRALHLFVQLAETLHFGRTAAAANMAQSALSAQIRRLEDQLGTALFARGRRSAVRLTESGSLFLDEARQALAAIDRAERVGRLAGLGEAGPVRIGYVLSAALNDCLFRTLDALRRHAPGLAVEAEPMETPEQLQALAGARLDLGLVRPRAIYPPGVEALIVHEETMVVAMARDHPLAAQHAISPSALAGETFIFPQFTGAGGFEDMVLRLSGSGRFQPRDRVPTKDFMTAIALAAAGFGVVLAPQSMARIGVTNAVFRPLMAYDDRVPLAVAWRSGSRRGAVDHVIAALREAFAAAAD